MARNTAGYLGVTPSFDGPNGFMPGAWDLTEVYRYARTNTWVKNAWPAAYTTLINGFATQRYVSTSGNNGNPGTNNSPWLTLEYAIANTPSGGAIVINGGTYAINTEVLGYSEGMLRDATKALHFIGQPGRVIITEANNGAARDNHMWSMQNTGSTAYGLILKRDNNGRSDSYATAIIGRDSLSVHGKAYNCVFQEINGNGLASFVYDNQGSASARMENCLFVASNFLSSYSGGSGTVTLNSACTSSFSTPGTNTNNVSNAAINSSYRISNYSNSTYGVYSGTYGWP